jgi:hypothetical protein
MFLNIVGTSFCERSRRQTSGEIEENDAAKPRARRKSARKPRRATALFRFIRNSSFPENFVF